MSDSANFFVGIFVLLCAFSVIIRDISSDSALFWSIVLGCAVIFASKILKSEIFLIFVGLIALISRPVTIFAHQQRRKKKLRENLLPLVFRLIFSIKSGQSLRESLRAEAKLEEKEEKEEAKALLDAIERRSPLQFGSRRWEEFSELLIALDRDPAHVLQQLENFRRHLQIEGSFSKKVAQILVQPRLQAAVIAILYLGLVGFVYYNFEARDYSTYFLISLFLVSTGAVRLYAMGRTFQWKV